MEVDVRQVLLLAGPMALAGAMTSPAPPDPGVERAALFRLDRAWAQAAAAKDVEKTLSFWADDASVIPPGQPAVVGKGAIREYISAGFALPGFSIHWETTSFVVSPSGDMAYGIATNKITVNGPQGNQLTDHGRAITVWRKDPGGSWRCVVDIWNAGPAGSRAGSNSAP
jgi:ketosteroid isomerase-like protein